MLIGVISDTHIPERASEIPETVFKTFENVDMILHAGDLVSLDVIDALKEIAPMKCVQGNMDRMYHMELPESEVMEVEGFKIGLNHGEVYPRGDTQQLKYIAMELGVEILITGHTHWSFIKDLGGVLLLNPGSPTVPRLSDPSVMLLEIENQKIDTEIIKIGAPICKSLNFQGNLEKV
ncbi:metallophosphoesterase [Methanobacterium aggregans]|uniref:metallophosphoesterase n=1 Tax=Methanobacterium aggregans TaxID=1615586 RepID=UPI001AE8C95D|nr:metallophosphoesterase [Methanobacterium aggregans]MBP2046486.1 putative phosphoesterase [Methanobacterium aggregans]